MNKRNFSRYFLCKLTELITEYRRVAAKNYDTHQDSSSKNKKTTKYDYCSIWKFLLSYARQVGVWKMKKCQKHLQNIYWKLEH